MLFTSDDMKEPIDLDSFETLPIDESVSELAGYPMNKTETGKHVIALEGAIRYCDRVSCGIDDMIVGISEENNIPVNQIAFSVQPVSLYLNDVYNEVCSTLNENGFEVFINTMPYTVEANLIETAIQTCLDEGNTEALDLLDMALTEGWSDIKEGLKRGFISGVGRTAASAMRTAGGAIIDGTKVGIAKGGSNLINKRIFGALDRVDPNRTERVYNSATGQYEDRPSVIRNARVTDFMRNHGVTSNNLHSMVNSSLDEIRRSASNEVVSKLMNGLSGISSHVRSPDQMINAINRNLNFYGQRYGSGQGEPGQRGVITKVLDKLRALRDKLIAKFRGGSSY